LELQITDHALQASLLKGEALFSMPHRSTRPFTLFAHSLLLNDLGTVFDVKFNTKGGTAVAVAQGRVALSVVDTITRQPATSAPLVVNAGQIAIHQDNRLMLKPADPDEFLRQTTWTSGSLAFRGSKVAEIAAELNRYNRTQLVVEDPAFANKQITGTFVTDDPEAFVAVLRTIFPWLTLVSHREGDQIHIRVEGESTSD
jgi:transmembrane sensor